MFTWPFSRPPQLDWIQIEVSTHCPADCHYCPRHAAGPAWVSRLLPFEIFEKLLPELRRTEHVHLQGWGEPLTHPELARMVRLAKEARHQVGTTTNGMLLDEERAGALLDAGLDVLAFSVAGVDEAHDTIRRGTKLSRVRESIALVQELKEKRGLERPHLHIAYLLLRSRLDDLERIPGFLAELGVDQAIVSSLALVLDPALEDEAFLARDEAEYKALLPRLDAARDQAKANGCDLHYHLAAPFRRSAGCSENVGRAAVVSAAGEFLPCVMAAVPLAEPGTQIFAGERKPLPAFPFGSAHSSTLADTWRTREYRSFRAAFQGEEHPPACGPCLKRFIERAVARPSITELLR